MAPFTETLQCPGGSSSPEKLVARILVCVTTHSIQEKFTAPSTVQESLVFRAYDELTYSIPINKSEKIDF